MINNNNKYYLDVFTLLVIFAYLIIPVLVTSDYHFYSNDYIEYSNWYDSIKSIQQESAYDFGVGYEYIAYFFKQILNLPYVAFNIAMIYIALGLKIYIFSSFKGNNRIFSLVTYLLVLFPFMEMAAIRDALATGLFLLVIAYENKINFIKKVIILIIATSIHYVALIYILAIIFRKFLIKNIKNILYLISFFVLYFIFYKFIISKEIFNYVTIPNRYFQYFNEDSIYLDIYSTPTRFGLLLTLLIPILSDEKINFYKNVAFIFLILSIIIWPINLASGRLLSLSYLFCLLWIYGYEGINKKFILMIYFLVSLYILLMYHTDLASSISKLIR